MECNYELEMGDEDGDKYISNGLRFATKLEAEEYGFNLALRWFAPIANIDNCRSTECDDPVTEGNEQAFKPAGHRVSL